jgi:hypothetical protein
VTCACALIPTARKIGGAKALPHRRYRRGPVVVIGNHPLQRYIGKLGLCDISYTEIKLSNKSAERCKESLENN